MREHIFSALFFSLQKFVCIRITVLSPLQKTSSTHSREEGPSVKTIPRNFGSKSQSSVDDLQ